MRMLLLTRGPHIHSHTRVLTRRGLSSCRGIVDFLKEFLHEDHGNADMKVTHTLTLAHTRTDTQKH